MTRLSLFAPLFLFVFTACAVVTQYTDPKKQTVVDTDQALDHLTYEDCLPEVRKVKGHKRFPPEFSFVRSISTRIILCDFSGGEKIRFFGKVIKVRGKPVSSGNGLIIFDRLSRKISADGLVNAYADSSNRFKINVKKKLIPIERYGLLPVFIISGKMKFIPKIVIGMIVVIDFEIEEGEFTALIWEYGNRISQSEVSNPFQELLLDTVAPSLGDGSAT